MTQLEPQTDREILIIVNAKVDQLCESIERFAANLEKLETTKVLKLEERVTKIEKWQSEWGGAYKVLAIIAMILSLVSAIKVFMK